MNNLQIKQLAESIALSGGASSEVFSWVMKNLSKSELKYFAARLSESVKNVTLKVYYAGDITDQAKQNLREAFKSNKVLSKIFANKNTEYIKDDAALLGGVKLESGDWSLDYSLSARIGQIIKNLKESL
jgi:F0F1-type ATP synthase delta subunit